MWPPIYLQGLRISFKDVETSTSIETESQISGVNLFINARRVMCEFEGWTKWLEPAFLLWKPGGPGYERPTYMTRTSKDKPQYSPEQELAMMHEQVNKSEGFDIDFTLFLCVFNYHPAELNESDFVEEPETTGDFLKKLSQDSLDDYNIKNETEYKFVEVVKANFHCAAGIMFLISFEVKDPYDEQIKPFQARIRYLNDTFTEYVFCRPKPNQEVEYVGTVKKRNFQNDAKKQRLE